MADFKQQPLHYMFVKNGAGLHMFVSVQSFSKMHYLGQLINSLRWEQNFKTSDGKCLSHK